MVIKKKNVAKLVSKRFLIFVRETRKFSFVYCFFFCAFTHIPRTRHPFSSSHSTHLCQTTKRFRLLPIPSSHFHDWWRLKKKNKTKTLTLATINESLVKRACHPYFAMKMKTYIMFFPVIIARSPRIVPGSDASGLVAPIILRLHMQMSRSERGSNSQ